MMRLIQNAMRQQAQRAMASVVTSRVGQITSYDPNTFTAKVQLQPDGILTGWLQISSQWIGNGWGLFAAPNIGDMVMVEYINGSLNGGMIVGRFWNLEDLPLAVQSGEFWIFHKKGQFIKLTNDGKLSLSDGKGATAILNGDGTISSSGTWTHDGDLTATGTVTGQTDVVGGSTDISLVNHTHTSESPGSPTSPPIP